jgi:hypothetical protein
MAPCVYFTLKQRIFSLYSRINMLDQRIGHNGIGDSNMPNEPTQIKSAGNKNALVHGLYAKDVLLPWDSREEFERLHADLKAEFFPSGQRGGRSRSRPGFFALAQAHDVALVAK